MITRTRSEAVPQEDETVVFNCMSSGDHGSATTPQSFTFTFPAYTRNFEAVTPNSYGGRSDWKDFQHFRSVAGTPMQTLLPVYTEKWDYYPHVFKGYLKNAQAGYHQYWWGSELEPYGSPGSLTNGLPGFYEIQPDGGFVPPPGDLDHLISDSLRVMMPGIKAELSLLNSVYELKDFRSYLKLLRDPLGFLKRLPKGISKVLETARSVRKTLREVSRTASSNFLQWKFAIQPLLSDISSIYAALSRTERRMNDLVTRAGRPQVRHYSVNWIEFPDTYERRNDPGYVYWPYQLASVGLYDVDRRVIYEPSTFHAMIEYSYYFTQYQLEHARVLSYLDAFGVNLNPAIIWNAIPWSFVVDWVIGVSQWLDSMKTRNMEPMINIRRYLWSVKRKRSIYVTRGITSSYYGLPPEQRAPMPVITETAYRRSVGIPDWNSFYTSGINSNELMLGAALVLARRRRRNRR